MPFLLLHPLFHVFFIPILFSVTFSSLSNRRGGGTVSYSVRPTSGRLGVRIHTATDLSCKTGSDNSTVKHSAVSVSVTGPGR